ncbi:hypothetical protein KIH31_09680 [Paenarthrobacter sp. DKR-5]|uniref:hypothetical protein n=1 Tax=Paenarthrobacter sp. DKR-5 TaxID=2835535 RepID=UPI001BDC872C|nr:hypothetical protein [Paenarthrobacter sp. DKR-5]MBT1002875.1 hypothetical protein [Paenarthrobacter sp. DKR-5]
MSARPGPAGRPGPVRAGKLRWRHQIARVTIDSLHIDAADHKTFELIADHGPEPKDLSTLFTSLMPDSTESLDAAKDTVDLPVTDEPESFRRDLASITAGNHRAEG